MIDVIDVLDVSKIRRNFCSKLNFTKLILGHSRKCKFLLHSIANVNEWRIMFDPSNIIRKNNILLILPVK